MSAHILGIDLGTTNSVVATLDAAGDIIVTPNAQGHEITPSAVYFDGDDAVVGADALTAHSLDPDNGVVLIKRRMGTEAPVFVAGQTFTPESISALILRQLVASATDDPAPSAVITVPAYFGTAEREATIQAGEIAGITVLELLDEPVAALMPQIANGAEGTFLVYDLGGGTFDTSVISNRSGKLTVVATDGHHSLGGADVDARLVEMVLERVRNSVPEAAWEELVEDRAALGALRLDVENVKKALSTSTSRTLRVRTREGVVTLIITREDLRLACDDLFVSTLEVVDRVISAARGKGSSSLTEIVMVGGSSRIPVLIDMIHERLGVRPRLFEPDLAVAKGAALRAHWLARSPQFERWRARVRSAGHLVAAQAPSMSVTPRAIGILVRDSFDANGTREFVDHLISGNTALPTRASKKFATICEGQEVVRIQVFEQAGVSLSDEVEHNRLVIDGELSGLGDHPAGSPIEVILDVAADGQLSVKARDEKSGRSLVVEAFVAGVIDSVEKRAISDRVGLIRVRG
jgi:molecular chaperone DnaK